MKKSMMKKLIAVLLTVCAVSLTACAGGGFYGSFADEGYTIRVRFETGGDRKSTRLNSSHPE